MGKPHHQLHVWKRSISFVRCIYELTATFPDSEKFGLISQMQRAAVSIPSNIAEGAGRNSKKGFVNFLYIAQGSIAELETQLLIAQDLKVANREQVSKLLDELDEISKMIIGLQKSLRHRYE